VRSPLAQLSQGTEHSSSASVMSSSSCEVLICLRNPAASFAPEVQGVMGHRKRRSCTTDGERDLDVGGLKPCSVASLVRLFFGLL
jgi:hypothetical protein